MKAARYLIRPRRLLNMIINSAVELEVGKIINGDLTDMDGVVHIVTFLVIRIATDREYMEYIDEIELLWPKSPYFYEIHMD